MNKYAKLLQIDPLTMANDDDDDNNVDDYALAGWMTDSPKLKAMILIR